MELSKRLQAVADKVTVGNRVADVGCDHGYVAIYLIKEHIADKVIAMDVNVGPLGCASEHIAAEGLSDYIETRLSDGLKELTPSEVDTIICAGMGGRLTVRILSQSNEITLGAKELILQPQSEIELVREYLYRNGFTIVCEDMVLCEGKYYQIMKAQPVAGEKPSPLSLAEAKYGPCLIRDKNPVLKEFLLLERQKYQGIFSDLQKRNHGQTKEIEEKLSLIDEALAGYTDEV